MNNRQVFLQWAGAALACLLLGRVWGGETSPGYARTVRYCGATGAVVTTTYFDLLGNNEMALLARPVNWYGRIAKVILVMVHRRDSYLLKKQVASLENLKVVQSMYIS